MAGPGVRALGAAAGAVEVFLGDEGAVKLVVEGDGGGRGEAFCNAAEFLLALQPAGPGAPAVAALQAVVEEGGQWARSGCAWTAVLAARVAEGAQALREQGCPGPALVSGLRRAQGVCEAALAEAAVPVRSAPAVREATSDPSRRGDDGDLTWFFEPPGTIPQPPSAASLEEVVSGEGAARKFRELATDLLPRFPGLQERLDPAALDALVPPTHSPPHLDVTASAVTGPCVPGGLSATAFPGIFLQGYAPNPTLGRAWELHRLDEAALSRPKSPGGVFTVIVAPGSGPRSAEVASTLAFLGLARTRRALVLAGPPIDPALAPILEAVGASWVAGLTAADLRRCAVLAGCEAVADWADIGPRNVGAARAELWEGGRAGGDGGSTFVAAPYRGQPGALVQLSLVLRPLTAASDTSSPVPLAAVVCHPVQSVAEQTAELLVRFLFNLWETWERGAVVPGGGAMELLCARRLREKGAAAAAAAAVATEGGKMGLEWDPVVYECVATALVEVADRALAAFGVEPEARLGWLRDTEIGVAMAAEAKVSPPPFGVESVDAKARSLRAAFDVAHLVLHARATLTNQG